MWPSTLCRPWYLVQHQKTGQTWTWSCKLPSPGLSLLLCHSLSFDLQNHQFLIVPVGMGIPNASVSWHLSSPSPTYFPLGVSCVSQICFWRHILPWLCGMLPASALISKCLSGNVVVSFVDGSSSISAHARVWLQMPLRSVSAGPSQDSLLIPLWHFQCCPTQLSPKHVPPACVPICLLSIPLFASSLI